MPLRIMETNKSQKQASPFALQAERLSRDDQCPLCRGDNLCRVAKGYLYKGPCWCQEITVPTHVLRLLVADGFEPACLCRRCLETVARLTKP